MPTCVHSFTISGIDGVPVDIEAMTQYGKPQLMIIGLGDQAIREASERIQSAITVSGFKYPVMKNIINLAPGDLRKQGSHFELGMAIALLAETDQLVRTGVPHYAFFGELSLDGRIRGCSGMLPLVLAAKENGFRYIVLPKDNLPEATLVKDVDLFGFSTLQEVVSFFRGNPERVGQADPNAFIRRKKTDHSLDFHDVKGQPDAVRAALIAAAGGHNLLMTGSPGCGKTMIAQRIPSILPPLSPEESTEVTKIHSIAGLLAKDEGWVEQRPFRAPHHNVSLNALVGGGASAKPGEVSLAHHGVLFLDELPEYSRKTLEALRQPLEDGFVAISRVKTSHCYPAQMMLVAAMNPCPCGYAGNGRCVCTSGEIGKYHKKLSGPLLDRVDIHCTLKPVAISSFATGNAGISSSDMQQRVTAARRIQQKRFSKIPGLYVNSRMGSAHLLAFCELNPESLKLLQSACEQHQASARNYHRVLRIARTLADLDASESIRYEDVATALRYQPSPDMTMD